MCRRRRVTYTAREPPLLHGGAGRLPRRRLGKQRGPAPVGFSGLSPSRREPLGAAACSCAGRGTDASSWGEGCFSSISHVSQGTGGKWQPGVSAGPRMPEAVLRCPQRAAAGAWRRSGRQAGAQQRHGSFLAAVERPCAGSPDGPAAFPGLPRRLFSLVRGGSPGANGETLRPLSSLPPTPPFVIIPFLGQEVLPQ